MVLSVKPVDLIGLSLEAGSGAPVVLLREHDVPRRVLPIFVGPTEATAIALALGDRLPPRPLTHDLLATLVETLHAHVERVEVTELRDGTLFAELAVSGPTGERRLDSRPSDAIALAVRVDAPLFVSGLVLDEAGATLAESLDEEAIDDAVAQFRSALDTLDHADLQADPAEGDTEPGSGPDHPPDSPGD
jgi:bifunctional DNase/RNase